MTRFLRFHDRPEISGFTRQAAEEEQRLVLKRARQNYIEQVKDRAWDNRFRLIGKFNLFVVGI
jgi:hypothetical protein